MNKIESSVVQWVATAQSGVVILVVLLVCMTQLSGCGVSRSGGVSIDGAPRMDIDVSKVPDAVPKVEPYHPYGTRNYVLNGRRYRVLRDIKGYVKKGYASWYGTKFHGNHTSTQERYNLYSMTAASPELPLPSYVQVTNLRNGKQVVVRVNDRGPFHANRILDLSYAAAKKLDFVNSGTAPVKIVGIDPRTWKGGKHKEASLNSSVIAKTDRSTQKESSLGAEARPKSGVFLQLGAFTQLRYAQQLSDKISNLISSPVKIEQRSDLFRVHIGPLASLDQGTELKNLLEEKGFGKVLVLDQRSSEA